MQQKDHLRNKSLKKEKFIVVTTVVLGLMILTYLYLNKTNSISEDGIESVAQITGFDGGHATSGPSILYIYKVGPEKFNGSRYIEDTSNHQYDFYVVRYSSSEPSWSEILLNRPVTDTIAIKAAGFSLPKKKTNQFQPR